MLRWFGHRSGCPSPIVPEYRGEAALVCAACMPEVVPRCPLCGALAKELSREGGFIHYEFWYLCPGCVERVRAAGPWKLRRARANQARVEALQERFAELSIIEAARRRVVLGGEVEGRAVRLTLKIAARQGEEERFIFRVALRSSRATVEREELGLEEELERRLSRKSPSIVVDRQRWLRLGFRHLGKLDTVRVVEAMLEATARMEG
jgi:hypothetical protein